MQCQNHKKSRSIGFEPTQAVPNRFLVDPLNRSGTIAYCTPRTAYVLLAHVTCVHVTNVLGPAATALSWQNVRVLHEHAQYGKHTAFVENTTRRVRGCVRVRMDTKVS